MGGGPDQRGSCEISLVWDLIATAPVLRFTLGRRPGRAGSSMVRAGRS
jgi:hypothetical protein